MKGFRLDGAVDTLDMEDKEGGGVGHCGVVDGGKFELSFFVFAEGLEVGFFHDASTEGHLAGDIIAGAINRNDAFDCIVA